MHALHLHGYVPLEDCDSNPQTSPKTQPINPRQPPPTDAPIRRPKTLKRGRSLALRRPSKQVPASPSSSPSSAAAAAAISKNAAAFATNSHQAETEWSSICATVSSPTGFGTVTTITAGQDEEKDENDLRSPRSPSSPARLSELGGKVKAILGNVKGSAKPC